MSTSPLRSSSARSSLSLPSVSLFSRSSMLFHICILWVMFQISMSITGSMTQAYLIPSSSFSSSSSTSSPIRSSSSSSSSSSSFSAFSPFQTFSSYRSLSSSSSQSKLHHHHHHHFPLSSPLSLIPFTRTERGIQIQRKNQNQLLTETQSGELRAAAGTDNQSVETQLVRPISKFMGEIDLPGSKSLSNRILLLASLCEGETVIENLLESEDIEYMVKALDLLNVEVKKVKDSTQYEASEWKVVGNGKPFKGSMDKDKPLELFLGNAGTAMRPLSAVLCGGEGSFVLDGVPRMRERPIQDLIDGLRQLDIDISCSNTGCPPGKLNTIIIYR